MTSWTAPESQKQHNSPDGVHQFSLITADHIGLHVDIFNVITDSRLAAYFLILNMYQSYLVK